jgi:ribonuclease D
MDLLPVNRLSREYINSLSVINFEGKVVVVNSLEQEREIAEQLRKESCIGFDTESRPSFKKGICYPISLLQLATSSTAYLFQLKKTGFSDHLAELLEDEAIKKVGIGIKHDLDKLKELRDINTNGFIDLSKLAEKKGIIQVGARALTARYIKRRLVKSAQKTNWSKSELTPKQQRYAACDAWICLQIYPLLLNDLTDYRQFIEEETENEDHLDNNEQ